ncbi:hypothetical protein CL621_03065 [archaeon]|nr:hypothetical protein [archaeon]
MLEECYQRAIKILRTCSSTNGLFASGPPKGYDSIWARDSSIAFLGAYLEPKFKKQIELTLKTLSKHQSALGQIPNAVDLFSKRKKQITFATIDSNLWYIIAHHIYKNKYNSKLYNQFKTNIKKALTWISYQDINENLLPAQLPTTDWQDAFPHKYGYTINTLSLYYKVLKLEKEHKIANRIKKIVNNKDRKDLYFFNKKDGYFYSYVWKTHIHMREESNWFDSLGNLLAINFDLADDDKAKKILNYIHQYKLTKPYPMMTIYPPIKHNSIHWQDYFNKSDLEPYQYANSGIWTYIGCFYILALIKYKRFKQAEIELEKVAEANIKYNFPEWIHPKTKKGFGHSHAWAAGMYLLTYKSFIEKKSLFNI